MEPAIIGRQQELSTVDEILAAVCEHDVGLLIRGEPGIGKTALLDELVRRARSAGMSVLRTSPSEAETKLALAGIGDLFSEMEPDVITSLPAPQRRALETALLLTDPVPTRWSLASSPSRCSPRCAG